MMLSVASVSVVQRHRFRCGVEAISVCEESVRSRAVVGLALTSGRRERVTGSYWSRSGRAFRSSDWPGLGRTDRSRARCVEELRVASGVLIDEREVSKMNDLVWRFTNANTAGLRRSS